MPGRHYLTTEQATELDELLRWYQRIGRKLRLSLPPSGRQTPDLGRAVHWGKLDANLAYDDTTGVTVSIWEDTPLADSTRDIENVLPPGWLTSGTIASGSWVWIARVGGKWHVVYAGEEQTVVTDYRIDGPNKKFQKKTRNIIVMAAGAESGWTDVHTGGVCP